MPITRIRQRTTQLEQIEWNVQQKVEVESPVHVLASP